MKRIAASMLIVITVLTGALTGCSNKADSVMELGKYKITDGMYGYWMVSLKSYFLNYYSDAEDTDAFWSSTLDDGQTMEEYITQIVDTNVRNYLIGMKLFDDYGLTLSATAIDDIAYQVSDMTENYGGRAAANTALGAYDINLDIFEEIITIEKKLECVYDYLYGEGGIEAATASELDAYYKSNYMRIKYIYINLTDRFVYDENGSITYDSNGYYKTEPLTEDEIAAKRAKVEAAMARVDEGDSFDELVTEFSEVDMSAYPNGLYISNNDVGNYGAEVITAVMEMQLDEVRLVEDAYDAYIILKCPLIDDAYNSDTDKGQFEKLSEYSVISKYETKFGAVAGDIVYHEEVMDKYSIRA